MMENGLLSALREQKEMQLRGSIYHRTQIDFTYNSNHIEGSRLTKEQTRYIFETNTLGITGECTRVDDIIETVNHFRCIDYVIDHATEPLSETHIKQLHSILKTGTSDSRKAWFAVGEYKRLPNEVVKKQPIPQRCPCRCKNCSSNFMRLCAPSWMIYWTSTFDSSGSILFRTGTGVWDGC